MDNELLTDEEKNRPSAEEIEKHQQAEEERKREEQAQIELEEQERAKAYAQKSDAVQSCGVGKTGFVNMTNRKD